MVQLIVHAGGSVRFSGLSSTGRAGAISMMRLIVHAAGARLGGAPPIL